MNLTAKDVVAVVLLIAMTVLFYFGKITVEEFEGVVALIVAAYFGIQLYQAKKKKSTSSSQAM